MPISTQPAPGLDAIAGFVATDPGLPANIPQSDIDGGVAASLQLNAIIDAALSATGVNADGQISPEDMQVLSDHIRQDPVLYAEFLEGHGNDEGNVETGFHLVQGDGGAYQFQGRGFIDTVGDAIYHIGFEIVDGRFQNEDGDQNERVDDVAGWLNYFLNGENTVWGSGGDDALHSGQYSFDLAGATHEVFRAGGGNDLIAAGTGDDVVFAGDGNDLAVGEGGNDHLMGEAGDDILSGLDGDDTIEGGAGMDVLDGGIGADMLDGGADNDTVLGGAGDDVITGGSGDDTLLGQEGSDTISGGDGSDILGGNGGNDILRGNDGDDTLIGEDGDDEILGGLGNDVMTGDAGADTLHGGAGLDDIYAGIGNDTVTGGAGADNLFGQEGNDDIAGGGDADVILGGTGDDTLRGDGGNDLMLGEDGADDLSGGAGDDVLLGGAGDDSLGGGAGADELTGGAGADVFEGGRGADTLFGLEETRSADTFVFSLGDSSTDPAGMDVIIGFESGSDRIDLTGYGGLTWNAGSAFTGSGTGEVRFDGDFVQIDADGDGLADEAIELRYVDEVSSADFIF